MVRCTSRFLPPFWNIKHLSNFYPKKERNLVEFILKKDKIIYVYIYIENMTKFIGKKKTN
jgi:hypothetical protein